ncbi:MAG: carboxypeptidase regulatory-like domain-containing protein [wastewater metagenome]|nr:carboxypeptidase regulatory-like domain-containing protein [Candidatus Loosdrechtia aerotolerans]
MRHMSGMLHNYNQRTGKTSPFRSVAGYKAVLFLLLILSFVHQAVYGAPSFCTEQHMLNSTGQTNNNQPPFLVAQFQYYGTDGATYYQNTQSIQYDTQFPPYIPQSTGTAPKVITGHTSSITHNSAVLNGIVNANGLETTTWFQYRVINGLATNTFSTEKVIGASDSEVNVRVIRLLPGTTYYYRLVAKNTAGITYGDELSFTTLDFKPFILTDVTSPAGSVSINDGAYFTNAPVVTLNLSATDNIGVTGYYVSPDPIVPSTISSDWISLPPFAAYTKKLTENIPYTLSNKEGMNTIYVWYKDFAGNLSSMASASIVLDAIPPAVTITDPAPDTLYTTTNDTISISGTASDNVSGVNSLIWDNTRGKGTTENKTINWIIPEIPLFEGDNVITIKITDGAGNEEIKTITVAYSPDASPAAITGSTANITPYSATLYGIVSPKGFSTTAWFEYGIISGSYTNRTPIQDAGSSTEDVSVKSRLSELMAGTTYYYRLVAQNSAGTTYGNEMFFNTAPPKGKIYGSVVNLVSDRPVRYAKLKLRGRYAKKRSFKVIFSDAKGTFTFKDLDPDTYDIFIKKIGLKSTAQTIRLAEGEEKKITLELKKR